MPKIRAAHLVGLLLLLCLTAVYFSSDVRAENPYLSTLLHPQPFSDTCSLLSVNPPAKVQKEDDKKEKEKNLPNYRKYLDNQEQLGFSPSTGFFSSLHGLITAHFYGNVSQSRLTESTKNEIEKLLKEAKVTVAGTGAVYETPEAYLDYALSTYGTSVSKDLITYAALCGLLKGIDDPYTIFMTPREYSILMEQMQSASFGGIGVYIEMDTTNSNWLTVLEAIEGTPAYKAGMKAGDVIAEIDGKPTKGYTIDMAVAKLRGPQGSPVVLTITRKGTSGTMKFTLNREKIQVKSVTSKVLDNSIGYVRLRLFGEETSKELEDALHSLQAKGVSSIIMDLRNNGGGYITAAVDIASMFVNQGDSIVKVMDKSGNAKVHVSRGTYRLDLPLIVLVNKFSASASEITAGALRDYNRGTLVGTKTFGKGSVQQVIPFRDGSALKITVSHYYTPKGSDIDKHGLQPDVMVDMEPKEVGKDKDPQLDKAIELLKSKVHTSR
ncbi:MAG: S41 family peptidase [Candidatus Xenobiia bacterium LiM19]